MVFVRAFLGVNESRKKYRGFRVLRLQASRVKGWKAVAVCRACDGGLVSCLKLLPCGRLGQQGLEGVWKASEVQWGFEDSLFLYTRVCYGIYYQIILL